MSNKCKIIITISVILLIFIIVYMSIFQNNKTIVDTDISENISQNEIIQEAKRYEIKDLGKIECEKIGLNAKIKETVDLDVLSTAVGHFEETPLYNGNVCLAGHNTGVNENGEDIAFFKRLNELEIGDEISYHHMFGQYFYKVSEIKEIDETDLTVLESTSSDKLTLITCVKGKEKLRLCIVCDRI